jgi:hypothetical protein
VESDRFGLMAGPNTYGYVNGSPLGLVDGNGHVAQFVPAIAILGVGYFGGKAVIGAIGDAVELYQCHEAAKAARDALDAATRACASFPQGGACNSLGLFQQQYYRAVLQDTAAGAHVSADDVGRRSSSSRPSPE